MRVRGFLSRGQVEAIYRNARNALRVLSELGASVEHEKGLA